MALCRVLVVAVDREYVQIELMKRKPGSWARVFKDSEIGQVSSSDVVDYGATADKLREARAASGSNDAADVGTQVGTAWHKLSCKLRMEGDCVVGPKAKVVVHFTVEGGCIGVRRGRGRGRGAPVCGSVL